MFVIYLRDSVTTAL